MADYEALVKTALPSLADNKVTEVVQLIPSLGIESKEDLDFVKEEDLIPLLQPIQARKLIRSWKMEVSERRSSDYAESEISFTWSEETGSSSQLDWSERFSIPRQKLPSKLMEYFIASQKPSPPLRKEMIRIIVDEMLTFSAKPTKIDIKRISKEILNKYPQSFMDTLDLDGPKLGEGCYSLVDQITNRVDYVIKRRRRMGYEDCTQPAPSAETRESLEFQNTANDALAAKMLWLQEENKKANQDKNRIRELMDETYDNQRLDIEGGLPLASIIRSWPLILDKSVLFSHFHRLTKKNNFIDNLLDKAGLVVRTLGARKHKGMENVILQIRQACSHQKSDAPKCRGVLDVLTCYFKEDVGEIYKVISTDSSLNDQIEECGPTPILVIRGMSVYEFEEIIVVVEGLVCFRSCSFEQSLAYLFYCFYVFNMKYPSGTVMTYEFIQRYFGEIEDPLPRGSKRRRVEFHPRVLTAMRLLASSL